MKWDNLWGSYFGSRDLPALSVQRQCCHRVSYVVVPWTATWVSD